LLEDGNLKKILKIEIDNIDNNKTFTLKQHIDYPERIFLSSEINFSDNFVVGRKISKGKMFYIYKMGADLINDIDYYPLIRNLKHDPNYIYAPTLALNEEKNKIVVGMYFFDMFHLYDLNGNRIKSFCFSENCIPKFESDDLMQDLQNGYSGIIRVFPTNDYCYLLRITGEPLTNNNEKMLIKINWDGELIKVYKIQDEIEGQFYISEKEKKMYAIRHFIDAEEKEIYGIVSYSLDE
jgi:hypothetical protein